MSAIGAVGGNAASTHQPRQASVDARDFSADSAASNGAAPPSPSGSSGPLLASNVMGQLVGVQASASELTDVGTGALLNLPAVNLLTNLTSTDQQFIAAATGVQVAADGTTTNADGTSGGPVSPLILQIASDRQSGALQGDITPAYLTHLSTLFQDLNLPLDKGVLSKAEQYLASQGASSPSASSQEMTQTGSSSS